MIYDYDYDSNLQQFLAEEAEQMTAEEKTRVLQEYHEALDGTRQRLEDNRQTQRDHLMAKMAARKRLKEEVLKEEAVAKELEHLSKQQVQCAGMTHVYHGLTDTFFPGFEFHSHMKWLK